MLKALFKIIGFLAMATKNSLNRHHGHKTSSELNLYRQVAQSLFGQFSEKSVDS